MRSLYNHHKASRLYSKGRTSRDVSVITSCADQLHGYGFTHHADKLRERCLHLTPATTQTETVTIPKRSRKKAANAT